MTVFFTFFIYIFVIFVSREKKREKFRFLQLGQEDETTHTKV